MVLSRASWSLSTTQYQKRKRLYETWSYTWQWLLHVIARSFKFLQHFSVSLRLYLRGKHQCLMIVFYMQNCQHILTFGILSDKLIISLENGRRNSGYMWILPFKKWWFSIALLVDHQPGPRPFTRSAWQKSRLQLSSSEDCEAPLQRSEKKWWTIMVYANMIIW